MPLEIERKFLVRDDRWRDGARSEHYCQGYLSKGKATVRVRRAGDRAYLTVKGEPDGISRPEYEYEIPVDHAQSMLHALCEGPLIEKTRHEIRHDGLLWQVDEFAGANSGLIVAEVELSHPEQAISLPEWIGEEVTEDPRYYNSALATNPMGSGPGQGD